MFNYSSNAKANANANAYISLLTTGLFLLAVSCSTYSNAIVNVRVSVSVNAFAFHQPTYSHKVSHKVNHRLNLNPYHTLQMSSTSSSSDSNNSNTMVDATSRFPTSPEDQIRQASIATTAANQNGVTRHSIRLLLPIIGATELDDWPGGARQMMEAASPLMQDLMKLVNINNNSSNNNSNSNSNKLIVQESVIDASDGVRALFSQGQDAKDDSCAVLLPSADTVSKLQQLDGEVGKKRNLFLVNSQWRRQSDFTGGGGGRGLASFFGGGNGNDKNDKIEFVEGFEPTFHCTNVMVEGDIVRILRVYPGPWRVYLRVVVTDDDDNNDNNDDANKNNNNNNDNNQNSIVVDWVQIGTKDIVSTKTDWKSSQEENEGNFVEDDGGKLFDYGIPTYKEIETMITSREDYVPKSLSERAAAALTFIKDSL